MKGATPRTRNIVQVGGTKSSPSRTDMASHNARLKRMKSLLARMTRLVWRLRPTSHRARFRALASSTEVRCSRVSTQLSPARTRVGSLGSTDRLGPKSCELRKRGYQQPTQGRKRGISWGVTPLQPADRRAPNLSGPGNDQPPGRLWGDAAGACGGDV